ncbi:MAG: transcription antitermination factor NusB [Gemmatimonadota bacterium]
MSPPLEPDRDDLAARLARPPVGGDAGSGDWSVDPIPDSRSGARQVALQALYGETAVPGSAVAQAGELAAGAGLGTEHQGFALALVRAAVEHMVELDELIAQTATGWRLGRMARVDLAILRLSLAEMLHLEGIPPRVSIDQAVELARLYGGEQSYAFVNGILDAAARRRGLSV